MSNFNVIDSNENNMVVIEEFSIVLIQSIGKQKRCHRRQQPHEWDGDNETMT